MDHHETLGIVPLKEVDELLTLCEPIIEPALRAQDRELARSAFRAFANILQASGYAHPLLAEDFLGAAEQHITHHP